MVTCRRVGRTRRCSRFRFCGSDVHSGSPRAFAFVFTRRSSDAGRTQSNCATRSCQGKGIKVCNSEELPALRNRLAFSDRLGGAMGRCENRAPAIVRHVRRAVEWRRCGVCAALRRCQATTSLSPPAGSTWTSHSLRIGFHTERTLIGQPGESRKAWFRWRQTVIRLPHFILTAK
jgi:hypothetical protein